MENEKSVVEELLVEAIETANDQQVVEIVGNMSSQETLRQASMMSKDERLQLVSILSPETAANLLEEAPSELAVTMLEGLNSSSTLKILDELHSNTQADIVQELDSDDAEALYASMEYETAENLRQLVQYDPNTAGGLMELEVFSFKGRDTVDNVLKHLVDGDNKFERYRGQHPYVVDEIGKLVGVVSLRDLLSSKHSVKLSDIATKPVSVNFQATLDELISVFDVHSFLGIPVVDEDDLLLGVVSRTDVANA